jgi:hypothetical protein
MRRNAHHAGQLRQQIKLITCRYCMVMRVWTIFAEKIFPLVRSLATPKCISDAMDIGEDAVKGELEKIKALALDWLTSYVRVYGRCVTPYVHVLGRHLHHMLSVDGGYTMGTWSQQGFEACHKLVRKILNRKTAHGGGKARKNGDPLISPLLQVLQHVYRSKWGMLRFAITHPPRNLDVNNPLYVLVVQDLQARYESVDEKYGEMFPDRDVHKYITRSCKASLKKAWKLESAQLRIEESSSEHEEE